MTVVEIAGWTFAVLALGVAAFQTALVAGAPWGHLTQGGIHAGSLPPRGRLLAAASGSLLAAVAVVVLIGSGVALPRLQAAVHPWIWGAVAVSVLSVVANAATRSRSERALWLPVALLLLSASLVVALGGP